MFKHLLVPLDGSQLAEAALPAAAYLAQKLDATVTLVHIIEHDAPAEVHGERHLTNADEANAYLTEVARRAFPPGVHTSSTSTRSRSRTSPRHRGSHRRAASRSDRDVYARARRAARPVLRQHRAAGSRTRHRSGVAHPAGRHRGGSVHVPADPGAAGRHRGARAGPARGAGAGPRLRGCRSIWCWWFPPWKRSPRDRPRPGVSCPEPPGPCWTWRARMPKRT